MDTTTAHTEPVTDDDAVTPHDVIISLLATIHGMGRTITAQAEAIHRLRRRVWQLRASAFGDVLLILALLGTVGKLARPQWFGWL